MTRRVLRPGRRAVTGRQFGRSCARLIAMNSPGALGVESCMRDRTALATVAFGWYSYYGQTTQGRAYR
jgi:hypothetical protein